MWGAGGVPSNAGRRNAAKAKARRKKRGGGGDDSDSDSDDDEDNVATGTNGAMDPDQGDNPALMVRVVAAVLQQAQSHLVDTGTRHSARMRKGPDAPSVSECGSCPSTPVCVLQAWLSAVAVALARCAPAVTAVDLSHCGIHATGGQHLSRPLSSLPHLTRLSLPHNGLSGPATWAALGRALPHVATLKELDISGNGLAPHDALTVGHALQVRIANDVHIYACLQLMGLEPVLVGTSRARNINAAATADQPLHQQLQQDGAERLPASS